MNKPVTAILEKEMSRKEFLGAMGLAVASVLGFSNIIHMLTGKSLENHFHGVSKFGYGSTPYGGNKE
jgi:hypothetical protein